MKAYDVPAGYQFSLEEGGRSGLFVVKTGTPPSDPQEGIYIVLANGNYAMRRYDGISPAGKVFAEWFGASPGNADNSTELQAALDYSATTVSYFSDLAFASTLTIDRAMKFVGPGEGQYQEPRLTYNGPAGTWAVHVRSPGVSIQGHVFRSGVGAGVYGVKFHDDTGTAEPVKANLDCYFAFNTLSGFGKANRFVGRSVWCYRNLYSQYNGTAIELAQYRYDDVANPPSGFFESLEGGYRGYRIESNTFHGGAGVSIRNTETGAENLYGCQIINNLPGANADFFEGSLKDSLVSGNMVHRVGANRTAFILDTCIDVSFSDNWTGGEVNSDENAMLNAFVFRSSNVSGLRISGEVSKIWSSAIVFLEVPTGSVNISGSTFKDICLRTLTDTFTPPVIEVRDTSSTGASLDNFNVFGNTFDLREISSGYSYDHLIKAASTVTAFGRNMIRDNQCNESVTMTNIPIARGCLVESFTYSGDGAASKSISLAGSPASVLVCNVEPADPGRLDSVLWAPGTAKPNDLVEVLGSTLVVKGVFNNNSVYTAVVNYYSDDY